MPPRTSEQRTELVHRQPGIAHDTAHRDCVDRIVSGNRENALPVSHHDVLALASDPETSFLERPNRLEMVVPRSLGTLDRDLDFPNVFAS